MEDLLDVLNPFSFCISDKKADFLIRACYESFEKLYIRMCAD